MSIHHGSKPNFVRVAAVGLLAGCAWFLTSSPIAFAQDQTQGVSQQDQRNDGAIQSAVMAALGKDSTLNGQKITATSAQGVVTLTGTVQTDAQRQQAETDTANVSGVSGILNRLDVTKPGTSAPAAGLAAQESANQLSPQDESQNQDQGPASEPSQNQAQGAIPPPPPDQNTSQPQPAYSGPRPEYQPGYAPQQNNVAQVPYYATPAGPVTLPAGTLLRIRLDQPLDTAKLQSGTFFQATAVVDVYENGLLAVPRGAMITGQVIEAKNAGDLGGSATLRLQLTNIQMGGKVFPIATDIWSSKGPNKAGYTAVNTVGASAFGAIIGGILGRGAGAAIGAGVGAVGGLAASSATKGPRIYLPVESQVDFHLTTPAIVQPVSWQEAQRLATSVPSTQPVLIQRPRPVYVVPGPYPVYPYPY
jgi:hypothetical protein